jgi:hypothetical protein
MDTILHDAIITIVVALLGLLVNWLQNRTRLPKWARVWLARITTAKIEDAIEYAEKLQGLTPEQRREEAIAFVLRSVEKETGMVVPASVINLLIEFVYSSWKRRQERIG